jgi:hypothetical protein
MPPPLEKQSLIGFRGSRRNVVLRIRKPFDRDFLKELDLHLCDEVGTAAMQYIARILRILQKHSPTATLSRLSTGENKTALCRGCVLWLYFLSSRLSRSPSSGLSTLDATSSCAVERRLQRPMARTAAGGE